MSAELVPLEQVHFRGGRRWREPSFVLAVEPLPRNTMDPRYPFCLEHRTACVCREAELAEQMGEYRYELDQVRAAVVEILVGHRLFDFADDNASVQVDALEDRELRERLSRGDGPLACQCSGCRLVRAADLSGVMLRADEHGVVMSPAQYEAWSESLRRRADLAGPLVAVDLDDDLEVPF